MFVLQTAIIDETSAVWRQLHYCKAAVDKRDMIVRTQPLQACLLSLVLLSLEKTKAVLVVVSQKEQVDDKHFSVLPQTSPGPVSHHTDRGCLTRASLPQTSWDEGRFCANDRRAISETFVHCSSSRSRHFF